MREVLAAAALGLAKGLVAGVTQPRAEHLTVSQWAHHSLLGPLYEETVFRALPLYMHGTKRLPVGWTAVPFAMEHVLQESSRGRHQTVASAFGRFADVFLGGVLYEKSFRRWGILGAFLAHAAHNIMTNAGVKAANQVRARRALRAAGDVR